MQTAFRLSGSLVRPLSLPFPHARRSSTTMSIPISMASTTISSCLFIVPTRWKRPDRAVVTFASLSRREVEELLKGIDKEHHQEVTRCVELAARARDTWSILYSPFYPPPVVHDVMMVLRRLADVVATPWGGYEQAERQRVAIARAMGNGGEENELKRLRDGSVASVELKGNFLFDRATHRDFLGAVLGTGIERAVVGDILIQGDRGAQIVTTSEMVEHLEMNLTQVRSVPVTTTGIEVSQLRVPQAKTMDVHSIESSLRLDSIASAGFRASRQKAVDAIKGGDVKLNWRNQRAKPSSTVQTDDVISWAGKGRVEVKEISTTSKGKYSVHMVRYI